MDTAVKLSVYDDDLTEARLNVLIDSTFSMMGGIEKRVSVHYDSSEINRVNESAGEREVQISSHLQKIIAESQRIAAGTGGAFDISVGPLKEIWGFDRSVHSIPDSAEIQSYLSNGNFNQVLLIQDSVKIQNSGLAIDLGGIAKGYIIDCGVRMLQDAGVDCGLVEGGGDMRVFGSHPKRKYWRIGIQHPRSEHGEILGILSLDEESVATSGDYERYFMIDGVRYHHLLDPKTGYPARGCISVTIIADNAMQADAYATAVFIMGPDRGMRFLETHQMMGVIITEDQGEIRINLSPAIRGKMESIENRRSVI